MFLVIDTSFKFPVQSKTCFFFRMTHFSTLRRIFMIGINMTLGYFWSFEKTLIKVGILTRSQSYRWWFRWLDEMMMCKIIESRRILTCIKIKVRERAKMFVRLLFKDVGYQQMDDHIKLDHSIWQKVVSKSLQEFLFNSCFICKLLLQENIDTN